MTAIQQTPAALAEDRRDLLARRIRLFVTITILWNVIEAVVALTAGAKASSSALIGFGLDSIIEVSSAAAVAWQFAGRDPEAREKVALRVIAFSFFGLAAFVTVDALRSLIGADEAQHSGVGLVLAALSLAVMPLLSYAQRRAGRELGSRSAVADSKQTLLCTYLSAVLLVGLALNSLFGWSWADPLAALVIAGVAVKEGLEAWRGDSCCAPGAALHRDAGAEDDGCGCGPGCTDACCTDACCTGTGTTRVGAVGKAAPLLTISRRPESTSDRS
jgi:Co/Zn/Cd efflux system component